MSNRYDKMKDFVTSIFNVFKMVNKKAERQQDKRLKIICLIIFNYVRYMAKEFDINLIDINNIGNITDNQGKEAKKKIEIITELLKNIGYDYLKKNIQSIIYFNLYNYGGILCNLNMCFVKKFDDLLSKYEYIFDASKNIIMCAINSPIIKKYMENLLIKHLLKKLNV